MAQSVSTDNLVLPFFSHWEIPAPATMHGKATFPPFQTGCSRWGGVRHTDTLRGLYTNPNGYEH